MVYYVAGNNRFHTSVVVDYMYFLRLMIIENFTNITLHHSCLMVHSQPVDFSAVLVMAYIPCVFTH